MSHSATNTGMQRKPTKDRSVAIFSLTRRGAELAARISGSIPGSVCFCNGRYALPGMTAFERMTEEFPGAWNDFGSIICIMSCGIVVRQVAPLLKSKTVDPAVVVLDEDGRFAISLVSGHLGGANELARRVAQITGGQAVVTTASDIQGKPAIDLLAQKAGLLIENPEMLSTIAAAVLDERPLWIFDPEGILLRHLSEEHGFDILPSVRTADVIEADASGDRARKWPEEVMQSFDLMQSGPGIWVSEFAMPPGIDGLKLRPETLVIGVGCNRGTSCEEIVRFVAGILDDYGLSSFSIKNFASLDVKSDERGLLDAAEVFKRPISFFTREEVAGVAVPNPSRIVARHIGAESVCEASALWSARSRKLLVPKRKAGNCTMAIALADSLS